MNLNPGEVWLADLGIAAKMRPVIVVSRHDPDPPRALAICVPITTQNRGSAYEVELPKLPFLKPGSVANVQGLRAEPTAMKCQLSCQKRTLLWRVGCRKMGAG